MSEDLMRYDVLAQHALRGVVRLALQRVERDGLPGEHHFFIAFDTRFEGVEMSERLLKRYKDEMTIVIQHQYWNLRITEDHFEIELSFDNIPEKLSIPFAAIKGFFDPSVQFGLQFETAAANSENAPQGDAVPDNESSQEAAAKPKAKKTTKSRKKSKSSDTGAPDASNDDSKVVSLDAFRKK
ncbi:MAG: hypothetical protein HKN11_03665 [Rhizobiales bacterium]|nr:hypothetical protein [Hyphomicrobiales bacterium]